jgi:undecaprenyl diphosphate synthase
MNSSKTTIESVPAHIAIIMDGNGRWAEKRNQPRLFGHKAGVDSVRRVIETSREIGVRHLTLYAFSTENWKRPSIEVKGLMALLKTYLQSELTNMLKNDIKLSCFGEQNRLPKEVQRVLAGAIEQTKNNKSMMLNLALSYGGRNEIITGIRELARKCCDKTLNWQDITEEMLSDALYTAGQPDPDLLIRTGGENRLSNFLLWQASYAELYFTEVKWPDFGKEELLEAISVYGKRQRRYGKSGAQLRQE